MKKDDRQENISENHVVSELKKKIVERKAAVAVVGAGYVGLPLAVEKAKVGFRVWCIDRNSQRVDMINRGENYILDVKSEELKEAVEKGLIKATTGFDVFCLLYTSRCV